MRTTLDLDDELVAALKERHPDLTRTEAIEQAIRTYLAYQAESALRKLAGTIEIEDVSAALRRADRHT